MPDTDLAALLEPVAALARLAGAAIMEIYRGDIQVEYKDDCSPLTAADMAAHACIERGLAALTPDIPLLSEESKDTPAELRLGWSTYWLVDPLDGTKEFIKRNGEFTVNIALIRDHAPVLGVVYVPAQGLSYQAARGCGAFKQVNGQAAQAIAVRGEPPAVPVVVGSRSHGAERLGGYLQRLGEHRLSSVGSSLKFCLVAEGAADLYPRFGPTSEWDTAAAQCVVEQAGGSVVDLQGRPLRYGAKEGLLNPEFLVYGSSRRDWLSYISAPA
ncbi:3'(2'),5'-bisphosphate nucleotidase CysQ [Methylogaea oryzae]|uniref:3'(2'),5'-bisphosphate nucleotidase CysQ n=1 Tax=Methylogaea oryzae TaxID=1295382 RepID=A0A8D4VU50_9GAMM|nr:3'(2'),5'-bisphosphate nucleotidase CysQ [Methylogaea oryzae]BBL72687.1 3'(2'),5'-bisphosphate nucleotidase CysQ [Methylogaea oryzae]